MGWGDMQDISLLFFQFGNFYPVIVHINILAWYLPALINLRNLSVSRIFHCVNLVFAKKLDQKSVQVFRTGTYDDLFRQDGHSTEFF